MGGGSKEGRGRGRRRWEGTCLVPYGKPSSKLPLNSSAPANRALELSGVTWKHLVDIFIDFMIHSKAGVRASHLEFCRWWTLVHLQSEYFYFKGRRWTDLSSSRLSLTSFFQILFELKTPHFLVWLSNSLDISNPLTWKLLNCDWMMPLTRRR